MPKKYIITIAAILFAVILVTVIAAMTLGEDVPRESASTDTKNADDSFCLLVLGKDRASGLCDVMMLVSLDPKGERLSVMQIPRDTYAEYGSESHKKLNSAAGLLGGEEQLRAFLAGALGITIDGYLTLELDAFRKAVDAIGGVEIYLPERLYYSDPEQGLYIDLPAGRHLLDGRRAEMLVRFRDGYARGDLDRLDMQKRFLTELFKKLKTEVNAENAYELVKSIFPHVRTDMTLPLAVALGIEALGVESESLCLMTLPGEAVRGKSGASFFVMSKAPTERLLKKYFFADAEPDSKGLFNNEKNESFEEIYRKDFEYSVSFGDKKE